MSNIQSIFAYELLDSRGIPTIETCITLSNGIVASAMVPSGASTGSNEALELRDNCKRYMGKGVEKAIKNVHKLEKILSGKDVLAQQELDKLLIEADATTDKSTMGANAILSISLAAAKAAAKCQQLPLYKYLHSLFSKDFSMQLPVPLVNIINGGAHADNSLDIQEFMIVPLGANSFSEAMRYCVEVFYCLKQNLKQRKLSTAVGDEGGFAPNLTSNVAALDLIISAIEMTGLIPGKDISLALDIAANEIHKQGKYCFNAENKQYDVPKFVEMLKNWCNSYHIISIEDPLAEKDWEGWQYLTAAFENKIQLVGDDLFVTNTKLLKHGIEQEIANSILIKMNQIGTITETIAAIELASDANYSHIISHRSGETEDTSIADLAIASNSMQIKTGSVSRTDRTAKYNQLLRIEQQEHLQYAGINAFNL